MYFTTNREEDEESDIFWIDIFVIRIFHYIHRGLLFKLNNSRSDNKSRSYYILSSKMFFNP